MSPQRHLLFIVCVFFVALQSAEARPVSYPGGWTFMTRNSGNLNRVHLHYSPTARYSIGPSFEYFRNDQVKVESLQLNYLVKRWNGPGSQANLYFRNAIGMGHRGDEVGVSGWTGISMDWEDRRFFVSYANRFLSVVDILDVVSQRGRIGIAPYIAEYGGFHTWLMVQVEHEPTGSDTLIVTPFVRFFKGPLLAEIGGGTDKQVMANFIYRF